MLLAVAVPDAEVSFHDSGVVGGVDQVVDEPPLGARGEQAVDAEVTADRGGPGEIGVGGAEQRPDPGGGIGAVAERDHDLVIDVQATQLGGNVQAELLRHLRCQQVVVVSEDLLLGRADHTAGGDVDLSGDPGQYIVGQGAGQAVGLEQNHRPG